MLISGGDFQNLDRSQPHPWSRPAPHNSMAPWPYKNSPHGLDSQKRDTRTCPDGMRLVTIEVTDFQKTTDEHLSWFSRLWVPTSILKHVLLSHHPPGAFSAYLSSHVQQLKGILLCPPNSTHFYSFSMALKYHKQIPQTLCLRQQAPLEYTVLIIRN